jgi:5'-3' exoribonuclease 1
LRCPLKQLLILIVSRLVFKVNVGTPFMDKLQQQLKYFISKKISEDSAWRQVSVILSGHDTPGEGEHKIMEFIRKMKSAKDYNPNTRHW